MINTLKKFFKAKNNWHLFIIFLVFGISGSLSVIVSEPVIKLFKINEIIDNYILYLIIRILIIFPIYQIVLLLCWGSFWTIQIFHGF